MPTIFCCESCVCSDNNIDIDFDFFDERTNKKDVKKYKFNEKTSLINNEKNNNIFYFYFKDGIENSIYPNDFILSCISNLHIGKIKNIHVVNYNDNNGIPKIFI
jgi:hypothetical protein